MVFAVPKLVVSGLEYSNLVKMSLSEQLNGWNTAVSDDKDNNTQIDSELASIVSSLSALSNPNVQQQAQQQVQQQQVQAQQQQQIGGFRRASFNSNTGSDVDSEIFFNTQNSPMLRRTTLSVGGMSLPENSSSHAQNRLNAMNHYSASIAGGLTAQFQNNNNPNLNSYNGSVTNSNSIGVNNSSVTSGFFERFGRALAEGTREVELNVGVGSVNVGGPPSSSNHAGTGSRRASATTGLEHLSRVGSNTTLHGARRMSDTSEVLDSVSESLSMQNNEPNSTTIWNVAAAPVFRPQNAEHMQQQYHYQQQQQQQQSPLHQRQPQFQPQFSYRRSKDGKTAPFPSDQDIDPNDPASFANQQAAPFNYGYPGFNQFGMPMFLPPVLSPPPQPFPGMNGSNDNSQDVETTDGVTKEASASRKNQHESELSETSGETGNHPTMMPHPMAPYPFPSPYPFMYAPIKEDDTENNKDSETVKPPLSPTFLPPNPYMFMPPSMQPRPGNLQDAPSSPPSADNGSGSNKRNNDSKYSGKNKSNPYLHAGKAQYSQFSPPPSRAGMAVPPNTLQSSSGSGANKQGRQGKNARQNNKQPIVRSPLLEEFRNNSSNKVYKLSDIYGSALEFCKDQHGSRFIQQELATASDANKEVIFNEIRDQCIPLSHDVFGNYVIQKFFEHGTKTQREVLVDQFRGKMENLSLEMYACRVIQKAFEFLNEDQKVDLVSELSHCVLAMIKDQNGNHVIQKAIECIPIEKLPFILQSLRGQIYHLSTHSYGCRVVQRLLEFGTLKDQDDILNDLDEFIPFLIQDQYGNYVIQHILQHGTEDTSSHIGMSKQNIIDIIRKNVVEYSKHKFASNVVEKSVVYGSKNQIRQILDQILPRDEEHAADLEDNAPLILMMRDQYANYVVQKLVGVATGEDERLIVISIRSYLDKSNKNNTLGNRHLASVEKLATLVEKIQI